jgi:hypothetical protein
MGSFSVVDWVLLDCRAVSVNVGDLLSVDAGGMPIYQVTAVSDGLFSLRDERHPPMQVRSLERFRWRGVAATA